MTPLVLPSKSSHNCLRLVRHVCLHSRVSPLLRQVRELFADFYALSPTSFSLALPANAALTTPLADRTRDGYAHQKSPVSIPNMLKRDLLT